ncbi:unnamed protein product, partial [Didymodactylos carnosus]
NTNSEQQTSSSSNRHVSLANIASAFITERKSSSRRQSGRRKKRLTVKSRRQSNHLERCDGSIGSAEAAVPFGTTSTICTTIPTVHCARTICVTKKKKFIRKNEHQNIVNQSVEQLMSKIDREKKK